MVAVNGNQRQDWIDSKTSRSQRYNSRASEWCRAWAATQTRRRATEVTRHVHLFNRKDAQPMLPKTTDTRRWSAHVTPFGGGGRGPRTR